MKLKLIYKNSLAFLAFLLLIQDINATILTFTTESEKVKVYTSMNEIQDYGSKVAADKQKSKSGNHTYVYDIGNGWTPNLSVRYSTESSTDYPEYFGDSDGDQVWPGVCFLWSHQFESFAPIGTKMPIGYKYYFTFTSSNTNKSAIINSFILNDYVDYKLDSAPFQEVMWSVARGTPQGEVLASGSVKVNDGEVLKVNTGMKADQSDGQPLVLVIKRMAGVEDDLAVDDINFDELTIAPLGEKFTLLDINNPIPSRLVTNDDGSFTITAGGGDTWDNADSFSYLYQERTGDFDVRVQILKVDVDDPSQQDSAKGSLHIRANLTKGSPNVQLNATPMDGANYVETIFRPVQDGGTDDPPSGTINLLGPWGTYRPEEGNLLPVWLRVCRQRNLFRTFVSTDGVLWKNFSEFQMDDFPNNVYVGLGAVAHITQGEGSNENQDNRVKVSFSGFGNTPLPPSATVDGLAAGDKSPGVYPDSTVTAVNWHISLPTDGIGYTADKTQSGAIVWNSGGFGTISRDLLLSIDGEQGPLPFGIARYATGALDFGIGARNAAAAQENLGPYSNPNRQRIATPNASIPAAQSWFPSPKHGVLVTSTRKVGALQWKDGAAPFYANAFMAVDSSSTKHFNMDDGSFGGGDFYLRMAKLADTAVHPNNNANSAGGFQRGAFDCSVAWFPYSQGWKAGYFADATEGVKGRWNRTFSHSSAAGDGTFAIDRQISVALLRWEDLGDATFGGLATLSLPNVDSQKDGLLFLTGNDDNTQRGPQVNCAPAADGKSWTVAVRSIEENKGDPATYAANDKCEFSFLYVPMSAGNLIGGEISGSDGSAKRKAGQFTSTRLSPGKFLIQIPGKTGKDGMIILQSVGQHPSQSQLVDNTTLAYEATADGFVVEARALNANADATPGSVSLRDASFYFAWVDFVTPLTPTVVVAPAAPVLSVKAVNSQYLISWPISVSGYVLESSTSLTQSVWSGVTGVSENSVSIPADNASRFFRLRKP